MNTHDWTPIIDLIRESHRVLLTTHINPDGDAVGSEAAMFHFLKQLGKEPCILNASPLPHEYSFLERGGMFQHYTGAGNLSAIQEWDLIMVFDIGSIPRLGRVRELVEHAAIPVVCIDHHADNNHCFNYSVVDDRVAATVSLIYELIGIIDVRQMNYDIAEALYTGVMTDTGSFRFDNTNRDVFRMVLDLLNYGVQPSAIYRQVYETNRPEKVRLLGNVLQHIHYECEGRLAWFTVTQAQIQTAGAINEDVDGFTDFVRSIKRVEVAVMFLEINSKRVRVNFRSKGKLKINPIARQFGGGGHPFAAGAALDMSIDEAGDRVLPAVRQLISENLPLGLEEA